MSEVCLLLISDGREDYLTRTLESLHDNLPRFDQIVHVDDSEHRLGFAGAIQEGWQRVFKETNAEWIYHSEDDFVYNRPVPLDDLIALSQARPYFAQLSLRRQAVGAEIPHGGFMEMQPGWYSEHTDGNHRWVEHVRNWTTNPSLYRRELCTVGWPNAPDSEGHFGFKLREQGLPWGIAGEDVRFAFWGGMEDGREWVHHIGEERAGVGY